MSAEKCPRCRGTATVEVSVINGRAWFGDCPDCNGTGLAQNLKEEPGLEREISSTDKSLRLEDSVHPSACANASASDASSTPLPAQQAVSEIDNLNTRLFSEISRNSKLTKERDAAIAETGKMREALEALSDYAYPEIQREIEMWATYRPQRVEAAKEAWAKYEAISLNPKAAE